MRRQHLDDLDLLCLASGEVDADKRQAASSHLSACHECAATLEELRTIDHGLSDLAADKNSSNIFDSVLFAEDDPFRQRPAVPPWRSRNDRSQDVASLALRAAEEARGKKDLFVRAMAEGNWAEACAALNLSASNRLALLHALQECGLQISENSQRAMAVATTSLNWLRRHRRSSRALAERLVPWDTLWGEGHLLAAKACLWTREIARAQRHFRVAYRAFGRAGDEISLAMVELAESQRRTFAGQGNTALALAARSRVSFEARGLDDTAARALIGEGMALGKALNRREDSIDAYLRALPVIERFEQWPNYIGLLNSLATSFNKLGRFYEARRVYARALRRFSAKQHRAWSGFLRVGLAETLFAAGRFHDAAIAFGRATLTFRATSLVPNALLSALFEIESWARSGDLDRARRRLDVFLKELQREKLDKTFSQEVRGCLNGKSPDYERLAALRGQIADLPRQVRNPKGNAKG